jgi:hypothetical protein
MISTREAVNEMIIEELYEEKWRLAWMLILNDLDEETFAREIVSINREILALTPPTDK